ncbi:MAG: hypothetical protein ACP5M9_03945 [Candidatus Micrarchaeia archaeon]
MPTKVANTNPVPQRSAQIPKNVAMELEKEKIMIINLCNSYSKNKDDVVANKINELNLHMHAKIAVISESLSPDDIKSLDKIQGEANKAVEAAAGAHNLKVNYVDIKQTDVTINGKTEKLHRHLHHALENSNGAENFVSVLPTEVAKKLKEINLDVDKFLTGDQSYNTTGIIGLYDIHRKSKDEETPPPAPIVLNDRQKDGINEIIKGKSNPIRDIAISNFLNNDVIASAITGENALLLLMSSNKRIKEATASSKAINNIYAEDLIKILNTGMVNSVELSREVIKNLYSNPAIIEKIGEHEYEHSKKKERKSLDLIKSLAADKLFSVLSRAVSDKKLSIGGKNTVAALEGLAGNEAAIELMLKEGKKLHDLVHSGSLTTNNKMLSSMAKVVIDCATRTNAFWKDIESKKLHEMLAVPILEDAISRNPSACLNLDKNDVLELLKKKGSEVVVAANNVLIRLVSPEEIKALVASNKINIDGLSKNTSLAVLGDKYLNPNKNNTEYIFRNASNTVLLSLAGNEGLFSSTDVSEKTKKRLVDVELLRFFGAKTANTSTWKAKELIIRTAFLNPELVKYAGSNKVAGFLLNYESLEVLDKNPEVIKRLNKKDLKTIIETKNTLSDKVGGLEKLLSMEETVNKLSSKNIDKYIDEFTKGKNITRQTEEIFCGIIKNNGIIITDVEAEAYAKSGYTYVRAAIASRPGANFLLKSQDIIALFNDADVGVRSAAILNENLLLHYLNIKA